VPKVRYGTIFEDFNTHIDDSIEDLRFPEITKTVPKVRYMRGFWLFFSPLKTQSNIPRVVQIMFNFVKTTSCNICAV
jgi:hypothetical protein